MTGDMRTSPIEEGAERGKHIVRTPPAGLAKAQRRQCAALAAEADKSAPGSNTQEEVKRMPSAGRPSNDEADGEGRGPADKT